MNDGELDLMVAAAAPITDGQVASLGLRDAETELMEEIMATTTDELQLARAHPPRRPRQAYRVLVAAAAVVAVTAVVLSVRGQDDAGSVDTGGSTEVGTTELPRLVPEPRDVPDGFELVTLAEAGQVADLGKSILLGLRTEGLPAVDLTISWNSDGGPFDQTGKPDFVPTTVRGHDGFSCSGETCIDYGGGVQAGIEWMERSGKPFRLTSPSLTVDQLVAIAEGLDIGGHDAPPGWYPAFVIDLDEVHVGPLPDDLPVALEELGRSDHEGPDPMVFRDDGQGLVEDLPDFVELIYWLDYSAALSVLVEPGSDVDLAARLAATGAEPIADVRGHRAWVTTQLAGNIGPGLEQRQIFWQEAPGLIVTVGATGGEYDDTVLRDVAEGLHEATDAEWDDLVFEASPEGQSDREGAVAGEPQGPATAPITDGDQLVEGDLSGTGTEWQGPGGSTPGE